MKASRVIAALLLVLGLVLLAGCSWWNREPIRIKSEAWANRALYTHEPAPPEDDFFDHDDGEDPWNDAAHSALESTHRDQPLPKPGPAPRTKKPRGSGGGS